MTDTATTMQALVVTKPGSYELSQVPIPTPGSSEALCRVRAIAICGTDPHIIEGDFPGFWPPGHPFIPGHEWAGEIVSLGDQARLLGWAEGDRVAGSSHAGCGYCRKCQLGRYNLCENYGRPEVHSQYGHTTQGAYATFVVHSVKSLTHIPDSMPFDQAAMLDTTSIAMHTVNRARLRLGEDAAVLGSGVMGLLAAECLRAAGAGRVIVVGRGARLEKARDLGYLAVDTTAGDPVAAVRAITDGLGVEVALECAGVVETVRWGVDMLRRGGRLSVIGIPLEDAVIPMKRMVLDEIELLGVRANAGEMADVVPLVSDGRIRVGELITHHFPLESFEEAYRTFLERRDGALKVIVEP